MTGKSIIIIGAGLAGLSAGCYAQMNGYSSHIFEHHTRPGGVAATWKRQGYTIDGGIHFVSGHKPGTALYELYRELGVVQNTHFVDMTVYGRFVEEATGWSVVVTQDLDRLAADWKALSPADARVIDELIAGARALQGLDLSDLGLSKPPELISLVDQLKELWAARRLFKYMRGRYAKPVADYVRSVCDPSLRVCIESLFLPGVPVWFVLMILAMLADGQMGLLAGGSHDFVRPIEGRYNDLGGGVTYGATVTRIVVENDRAVGVRLADGSEHRADAVVSAADGYSTLFEMLGGRYLDEGLEHGYANWPLCRPLMMVSYGVAAEYAREPPFSTVRLDTPFGVGGRPVDMVFFRVFNYGSFAPPGKTVVQVEFETEWDYWNDLQGEDRAHYEAEKERVATELLRRLEAHYAGISSRVEVVDVATPYTTWRYTRNRRGAWGGWLMTGEMLTKRLGRTLPGLDGFFMAGQWVMPGGGVPPSLYSGRHAIQLLCHEDNRPFVTLFP